MRKALLMFTAVALGYFAPAQGLAGTRIEIVAENDEAAARGLERAQEASGGRAAVQTITRDDGTGAVAVSIELPETAADTAREQIESEPGVTVVGGGAVLRETFDGLADGSVYGQQVTGQPVGVTWQVYPASFPARNEGGLLVFSAEITAAEEFVSAGVWQTSIVGQGDLAAWVAATEIPSGEAADTAVTRVEISFTARSKTPRTFSGIGAHQIVALETQGGRYFHGLSIQWFGDRTIVTGAAGPAINPVWLDGDFPELDVSMVGRYDPTTRQWTTTVTANGVTTSITSSGGDDPDSRLGSVPVRLYQGYDSDDVVGFEVASTIDNVVVGMSP